MVVFQVFIPFKCSGKRDLLEGYLEFHILFFRFILKYLHSLFMNFMQHISVTPAPGPPRSVPSTSLFLLFKNTNCFTYILPWSIVDLLGTIPLQNIYSLSPKRCHLPIAPQLGMGVNAHLLIHAELVSVLSLCRFYACGDKPLWVCMCSFFSFLL